MPNIIPDRIPYKMSNDTSKYIPENISNKIPNNMPKDIPNKIPEEKNTRRYARLNTK